MEINCTDDIYFLCDRVCTQNVLTVYSNIRAAYPNKNHLTTHPVYNVEAWSYLLVLFNFSMNVSDGYCLRLILNCNIM